MLALGMDNAQIDEAIQAQMMQAKYLREGNRPQMRNVGNVSVAPHWLEMLGGLSREGQAAKKLREVETSRQTRSQNTRQQQELMLRALLGSTPPQPAQGPGLMPRPSPEGMRGQLPPPEFM